MDRLVGILSADELAAIIRLIDDVAAEFGFAPESEDRKALTLCVADLASSGSFQFDHLRAAAERFARRLIDSRD